MLDANNNPTGMTTTITPIEQYRRALENLPGAHQPPIKSQQARRWFRMRSGGWAFTARIRSS